MVIESGGAACEMVIAQITDGLPSDVVYRVFQDGMIGYAAGGSDCYFPAFGYCIGFAFFCKSEGAECASDTASIL